MKSSNFTKKILFILLFLALALFVACGSSEEAESDTSDSGVTDNDPSDTGTSDSDTTDSDVSDSADDSDSDTSDTDTETDTETDTDTDTNSDTDTDTDTDTNPEPADDPDFEKDSADCTMIEVPEITMGGAYADEINGYFSPAMGDSAIDIIKILLMGEIKEGTYELGTGLNDNYAQCEQCVMVWVDAALAAANEYYFQTHGTLTIKEVKDVDGIKRTVGTIKNLIVKQAEANEYMSDFTLIPDGKCIAAETVSWDTTNTPGHSGD